MPKKLPPPDNVHFIGEIFARKANVSGGCIVLAGAVEDALRARDYDAMSMGLIDMFEELHMRSARGELQTDGLRKNAAFWLAKLQELSQQGSIGDAYGVGQAAVDVLENSTQRPEHIVSLAAYAGFMAYIEPVMMSDAQDADAFTASLNYLVNVTRRVSLMERTGDTDELLGHCGNILDKMIVYLHPFERYELVKDLQLWAGGHETASQILHTYIAVRIEGALQDDETGHKAILTIEEMRKIQASEQEEQEWPDGNPPEESVATPFFAARAAKQGVTGNFVYKAAEIDQAIVDSDWTAMAKLLNRYFQSMVRLIRKDAAITADGLGSPTIQYWSKKVEKLAAERPDKAVSLLAGIVQWIEEREGAPDPLRLAAYRAVANIYPAHLQAQKRVLAEYGFSAVKIAMRRAAEREGIPQFVPVYEELETIWQNFLEDCDPARRYREVKDLSDWLDAQSVRPESLDNMIAYYISFAEGEAIPVYEDETAGDHCLSADGKSVVRGVPKGIEPS